MIFVCIKCQKKKTYPDIHFERDNISDALISKGWIWVMDENKKKGNMICPECAEKHNIKNEIVLGINLENPIINFFQMGFSEADLENITLTFEGRINGFKYIHRDSIKEFILRYNDWWNLVQQLEERGIEPVKEARGD